MEVKSARPLEANTYLEQHKILPLFQELLQQIIVHKPVDPTDFLIRYLSVSHGMIQVRN